METFTFNGTSSESLNLIVKDMPLVSRAEKNIETIEVNGRNGNLHIDNGNYLSRSYSIACLAKDKSKIDEINSKLVGSGKLTLSKYNDRFFNATIKNQIDYSKYMTILQEFPLQFDLDPISFSNEETVETLTSSGSITVGGNVDIYPKISITGIGKLVINDTELNVSETDIFIDCELMNCTKNGLSKNDKVTLSGDDFPKLKVGSNTITLGSGITQIIIKYRKGWL